MRQTPKLDLSQYKQIRTNKFPLNSQLPVKKINAQNFTTIALLCQQQKQAYELYMTTDSKKVVMFNDHQCWKREFSKVFQIEKDQQEVYKNIAQQINKRIKTNFDNLIIMNALDILPIQRLIYKSRRQIKLQMQLENKNNENDESVLKSIITTFLDQKNQKSIITLSIMSIRSDGSMNDELNYQWIDESSYIEDLIHLKNRNKLKVKKFKEQIKVLDLNRQQIRSWEQGDQILKHFFQIKDYMEHWKQNLNPNIPERVGELYEISQCQIQEQLGYIKKVYKRTFLLKLNQYLHESSLLMMKISQVIKNKAQKKQSIISRDCPLLLFLRECFEKQSKYHITLLSQLGTNYSLKEQMICTNMDMQIPKQYTYLKNYCDKIEMVQQLKRIAHRFIPQTIQQKNDSKISSVNSLPNRILAKSIQIMKQSQKVTNKSFFFDTYSSNQKKVPLSHPVGFAQTTQYIKTQQAQQIQND